MELLKHDIQLEKYGGEVPSVELSAKTGKGMDVLEDTIMMQQEMIDPRSDVKSAQAEAVVIESETNRYTGVTCMAMVQWGTLRVGDAFVSGLAHGRIKSLTTPAGESVREAPPSTPVVVVGCKEQPPSPGDLFITVEDEKLARRIAENRAFNASKAERPAAEEEEEDDEGDEAEEGAEEGEDKGEEKALNLIIKADLEGSVEALEGALAGLEQSEVALQFVRSGVGEVTPADVELAQDAEALIVAFNVAVPSRVRKLAESHEIEIVESQIIYAVLDRCKAVIEDMLDPVPVTTVSGEAEVLQCFPVLVGGQPCVVGGSRMRAGTIKGSDRVRVVRNRATVFEGELADLRREKASAKEVHKNMECGIRLEGFNDFRPGDKIEALTVKMEKRKLWT